MIEVRITGMEQTTNALLDLPRKLRGTIIKRALNAAAKPIMRTAEGRAPDGTGKGATGALRAAISYHTAEKRGSRGTIFHCVIGVKTKSPRPRKRTISRGPNKGKIQLNLPTRTAHMIEYGFTHKRGGTSTVVAPQPFMRPAWNSQGGERALTRIYEELASQMGF